jgi:hypothetical protein
MQRELRCPRCQTLSAPTDPESPGRCRRCGVALSAAAAETLPLEAQATPVMTPTAPRGPRQTGAFGPRAPQREVQEACARLLAHDPLYSPLAELVLEHIGVLGKGGMGTVYEVRDRRVDRRAALKLLNDPKSSAEA